MCKFRLLNKVYYQIGFYGMNKSLLASLHFFGVSHHHSKLEIRSKYALNDGQSDIIRKQFTHIASVRGCVVITTCNRTEFIIDGGSEQAAVQVLCEFYGVNEAIIEQHFRYMEGWQVVRHLFRLTSGLDSMVLGDIQVTSQLKDAVHASREANCLSPLLSKLIQSAFRAGKRVRNETGVSDGAASVAYTALIMAREYLGPLNELSTLVVGTGNMGRDVAYNLRSKDMTNITVTNRTEKTGRSFAELVGGTFKPLSALATEIARHDIIITCTSAGKILIDKSMINDQNNRQLFLDLSLPPNIDMAVNTINNKARIDIDTIQTHVEKYKIARSNEVPKAEAIISEEMLAFQYKQIMDIASPAMIRLREEYELIRIEELNRTMADIDEDMLPAIELLTQRLVKRLAVMPIEIFCGHAEDSTLAMEEILDASYV